MDQEDGTHLKKVKGGKKVEKKPLVEQESKVADETKKQTIQPLDVLYCKICTAPPEFCMLGKKAVECKAWLLTTYQDLYTQIYAQEDLLQKEQEAQLELEKQQQLLENLSAPQNQEEKKEVEENQVTQPIEVKEIKKKKKVVKVRDANIVTISVKQRMKNKYITVISGLEKFDVNLKDAVKKFSKKYASGCSLSEDNKIEIQGDISYELCEYLPTIYLNITDEQIEVKEFKEKKEK